MTTATATEPLDDIPLQATAARPTLEIMRDAGEIALVWRAFEAGAVMTPYGRYDWVAAYQRSLPDTVRDTRVAIIRDRRGDPVLLMPFQIEHRFGLRIASAVGGKHVNYNLPLMHPDFAAGLTAERARTILSEAGRAMGADMILVPNMPVAWEGRPNPFAASGLPSASNAFALRLEADGEATLARSMSADARKKMRNKARRLEAIGQVTLARAGTPADARRALVAFYEQKARRFADLGIADPFSGDTTRAFLEDAATTGLAKDRAAIEFYVLSVGGEIAAVLGGAADGRRFSGMVLSFQGGELEKLSPGEMLVTGAIRDLCARGYRMFDLGVGDARYKRSICDEVEALVDIALPLTLRGRAAALAETGLLEAKRRIKSSPRAMAAVGRIRKLGARLRA